MFKWCGNRGNYFFVAASELGEAKLPFYLPCGFFFSIPLGPQHSQSAFNGVAKSLLPQHSQSAFIVFIFYTRPTSQW